MSNRLDDDSRTATAVLHVVAAIRESLGPDTEHAYTFDLAKVEEHLRMAEHQALVVINRGKDRFDPGYRTPGQTPVPPHSGQGKDE